MWRTDAALLDPTLQFVEGLMQPALDFEARLTAAELPTKRELVYQAGHASRWGAAGFVPPQARMGSKILFWVILGVEWSGARFRGRA